MLLRFRALLIHLSASTVLGLVAVAIVFMLWYPSPMHKVVGVTDIFLMIVGVDVVIGPLLTFIVYREGKKSLRIDVATIVFLQLSAFSYGLWTVAEGRPAWLVFNVDRFDLVQVYQIDARKLEQASPDFSRPSWFGPRWVSAHPPSGNEERKTIIFEALAAGVDIAHHPELYQPLSAATDSIRLRARPLELLSKFNQRAEVAKVLARWPEADGFLPMAGKVHPVSVLVHKESARVVAIVDLNPWD